MKTSSCKAKGRRYQQRLRDDLRALGRQVFLEDDDINSVGMGQNGVDILLSPKARAVFDLLIEAKNVEKLNVASTFWEHFNKYKDKPGLKLLAHTKNRQEPLVTLRWVDLLVLFSDIISERGHV